MMSLSASSPPVCKAAPAIPFRRSAEGGSKGAGGRERREGGRERRRERGMEEGQEREGGRGEEERINDKER